MHKKTLLLLMSLCFASISFGSAEQIEQNRKQQEKIMGMELCVKGFYAGAIGGVITCLVKEVPLVWGVCGGGIGGAAIVYGLIQGSKFCQKHKDELQERYQALKDRWR